MHLCAAGIWLLWRLTEMYIGSGELPRKVGLGTNTKDGIHCQDQKLKMAIRVAAEMLTLLGDGWPDGLHRVCSLLISLRTRVKLLDAGTLSPKEVGFPFVSAQCPECAWTFLPASTCDLGNRINFNGEVSP